MSEEPQNAMEGRARRRASPAGIRTRPARVEPEPPPPSTKKNELAGTARVAAAAVVYYLCRNHQLEHPHLMEVPLASPHQGLYLRDVVSRLDALRGKGMAGKYSWSCKRRYKSGFVWQDLCEGDVLLPAQGAEYVLKGSELLQLDHSAPPPDAVSDHRQNSASTGNANVELPKPAGQQEQEPPPPAAAVVPATQKAAVEPALPSASTVGYEEQCRMPRSGSSRDSSPKTSTPSSSGASSPGLNNPTAGHGAATQADDDKARGDNTKLQEQLEMPEIVDEPCSKHHQPAGELLSPCRARRRSGTLQSLIRAEAAGRRRGLLMEEERTSAAATGSVSGRLRPANLLARLISCGPSNPGFAGLVQSSYRPLFTRLEYPPSSPELCPLGALKPATEISIGGLLDTAAAKLEKPSASSDSHQAGTTCCRVSHSSQGDPVNMSRGTSERTSGPSSGNAASPNAVSLCDGNY